MTDRAPRPALTRHGPPDRPPHADWIIDLGPGAGHAGGRIVFDGTPADLVAARSALTGKHLAGYIAT